MYLCVYIKQLSVFWAMKYIYVVFMETIIIGNDKRLLVYAKG